MEPVDAVVIGAGVVGLAVARALALRGREVMLLEREDAMGTGVSSRNSEVIHAGIYYPTGSLKAQLCVQGRDLLYAYCEQRGIAHRRCGKFIVANTPSQLAALPAILDKARANGVHDLRPVSAAEARDKLPSSATFANRCHLASRMVCNRPPSVQRQRLPHQGVQVGVLGGQGKAEAQGDGKHEGAGAHGNDPASERSSDCPARAP